ncbi:hypothetical protein O181_000451 [Austropuccinia psidii MF-1]|uniref:Uncharacterized protein n=1 Tax=Austropuccinia psidii MF-1 TaxID=1389203 RepID=A0A9Q3GBL4_9BASI|nr:hypothetical protein [Austropuccinia psidii MF-1]
MASIDGKEEHDTLHGKMEGKQPSTSQTGAKTNPSFQKQKLQHEKEAISSEKGQGKSTSQKTIQPRLHNPKDSTGFHEKCVLDCQNHYGTAEERGRKI